MKRYFSIPTLIIFLTTFQIPNLVFSQNSYLSLIDSGEYNYQKKDYLKAGTFYNKAFKKNGDLATQTDRYNAACSWSLANNPKLAFQQLNYILTNKGIIKGWNDPSDFYKLLTEDKDFSNIHTDKRWNKSVEKALERKAKFESGINLDLAKKLDSIKNSDQSLRLELDKIRKVKGLNSDEEKELWKKINFSDSTTLLVVKTILKTYGWPSPEQVGYKGNQTIFLVIQHANIAAQNEFLPQMRQAVKENKALPKDLAYLEDRVAMKQGRKQIYGSQVGIDNKSKTYYLYPVEDVDNLDIRRTQVGLESIASYLKNSFNLTWDLNEYKKNLPILETKIKQIKKQGK